MIETLFENVQQQAPLIHNITNYVTVNDCANILLACGASPIMADDPAEVADIQAICSGLNINIGTLNERTIPAMFAAGECAVRLEHPLLLDPVGAGASALRTRTALQLMEKLPFTVIRGNISEIKTLALGTGSTNGVDANEIDTVNDMNLDDALQLARDFSARTKAVIAITGAIDIVTTPEKTYIIRNGHPWMSRITGSGCMLSALMTAWVAANPAARLDAAAAAVCAMGLCGEIAAKRLRPEDGNASYRSYLIDAVCNLQGHILAKEARYEVLYEMR